MKHSLLFAIPVLLTASACATKPPTDPRVMTSRRECGLFRTKLMDLARDKILSQADAQLRTDPSLPVPDVYRDILNEAHAQGQTLDCTLLQSQFYQAGQALETFKGIAAGSGAKSLQLFCQSKFSAELEYQQSDTHQWELGIKAGYSGVDVDGKVSRQTTTSNTDNNNLSVSLGSIFPEICSTYVEGSKSDTQGKSSSGDNSNNQSDSHNGSSGKSNAGQSNNPLDQEKALQAARQEIAFGIYPKSISLQNEDRTVHQRGATLSHVHKPPHQVPGAPAHLDPPVLYDYITPLPHLLP